MHMRDYSNLQTALCQPEGVLVCAAVYQSLWKMEGKASNQRAGPHLLYGAWRAEAFPVPSFWQQVRLARDAGSYFQLRIRCLHGDVLNDLLLAASTAVTLFSP